MQFRAAHFGSGRGVAHLLADSWPANCRYRASSSRSTSPACAHPSGGCASVSGRSTHDGECHIFAPGCSINSRQAPLKCRRLSRLQWILANKTNTTSHASQLDPSSAETNSPASLARRVRRAPTVASSPRCPGRKTGYWLFHDRARRTTAGRLEEPTGCARQALDAIHACSRRQHHRPAGGRQSLCFGAHARG